MKKIAILLFVATLCGVGVVYGGGYGTSSYTTDYQDLARIIVRDKVVEYDPDRFLGVQGYYRLGEHLTEKHEEVQASKHQLELDLLQKQIDLLKLQMEAARMGGKPMPKPEAHDPGGIAVPEEPAAPETPAVDPDKDITALFATKCAKCHGDTKKDGGLQLIKGGKLVAVDAGERERVFLRTFFPVCVEKEGLARMPKGGKALSDDEMNVIFKWQLDKSLGN